MCWCYQYSVGQHIFRMLFLFPQWGLKWECQNMIIWVNYHACRHKWKLTSTASNLMDIWAAHTSSLWQHLVSLFLLHLHCQSLVLSSFLCFNQHCCSKAFEHVASILAAHSFVFMITFSFPNWHCHLVVRNWSQLQMNDGTHTAAEHPTTVNDSRLSFK